MGANGNTKFTAVRAGKIVEHARSGLFRYLCAELEGIGQRTMEEWVAKGRDNLDAIQAELDDPEHTGPRTRQDKWGAWLLGLLAAEAQAEREILGVVHKLARACRDPAVKLRAAQWYLERKNNLRYGRGALRVTVGDDSGETQDVTDVVMTRLGQIQKRVAPADGSPQTH